MPLVSCKMIVDDNFFEVGKILNLNNYELKAWIALISKKKSTIKEISNISNLPKSRVYDVMESLCKKGLVIESLDKQKSFVAIPPHDVFNHFKKKVNKSTEERKEKIEKIKDEDFFKELQRLDKNTEKSIYEPDIHYNSPLFMDKIKREILFANKIDIFGNIEDITKFLETTNLNKKDITLYIYNPDKIKFDSELKYHFLPKHIEGICINDEQLYLKIYEQPIQTIEIKSLFFANTIKTLINKNKI